MTQQKSSSVAESVSADRRDQANSAINCRSSHRNRQPNVLSQ